MTDTDSPKNKFTTQMITAALLIQCGIGPTQAKAFADALRFACERYQIDTEQRFAAFMGQCMVESINLTQLEENLYYTTVERLRQMFSSRVPTDAMARSLLRNPQGLANRVYANRGGNGNETSGDGWKYRGRGIIQLTLKDNYANAAAHTGRYYVDQPDLVAQPVDAALTAAWYFNYHGCNALADAWEIGKITYAVNRAMAGANQRLIKSMDILKVLNDE